MAALDASGSRPYRLTMPVATLIRGDAAMSSAACTKGSRNTVSGIQTAP